jgi:hypothetical protein
MGKDFSAVPKATASIKDLTTNPLGKGNAALGATTTFKVNKSGVAASLALSDATIKSKVGLAWCGRGKSSQDARETPRPPLSL